MITRKVMIGGNNQLTVTIPKEWANKNGIRKNSYVLIDIVQEPVINVLRNCLERREEVVITTINNLLSHRSKIFKFVSDGVALESGEEIKFADIKKLQREVKEDE